jgi:hypothetical protein
MSGVKRLAQSENKGLEQVTNDDLREEGVAGDNNSDDK